MSGLFKKIFFSTLIVCSPLVASFGLLQPWMASINSNFTLSTDRSSMQLEKIFDRRSNNGASQRQADAAKFHNLEVLKKNNSALLFNPDLKAYSGMTEGQHKLVYKGIITNHEAKLLTLQPTQVFKLNIATKDLMLDCKQKLENAETQLRFVTNQIDSKYADLKKPSTYQIDVDSILNAMPIELQAQYYEAFNEMLTMQAAHLAYARCFNLEKDIISAHNTEIKLASNVKNAHEKLPYLVQIQKDLGQQIFNDPQLLKAVNRTIDAKGTQHFTVYNALRSPEESLLRELKLSPEDFTKCYGDYFQHCLFDKTNSILYSTALQNAQHGHNLHLKPYFDATAQMCQVSMNAIKSGSPHEAVAAVRFTEALHTVGQAAVNFAKGVYAEPLQAAVGAAKGAAIIGATTVVGAAAVAASPTICVGVATVSAGLFAHSLYHCDAKQVSEIATAFQKIPVDKQAQELTVAVAGIYGLTKVPYKSIIQNFEKFVARELIALSALHKVDQATIVTHNGMTFAKEFEHLLKPFIDSGKITTQADVIRYLEHAHAPFLTSFKEALEYAAPTQLVTAAAPKAAELTAVATQGAAQTKAGHELTTAGSAVAHEAAKASILEQEIIRCATSIKITEQELKSILSSSSELKKLEEVIDKLNATTSNRKYGLVQDRIPSVTKYIKAIDEAEHFYAMTRESFEDVKSIALNTGLDKSIIAKIKNHLFIEKHVLSSESGGYVVRRFDAMPEIAEAWQRLIDNKYVQSDLRLLKHEYAEALIMQGTKVSYKLAHYSINTLEKSRYNWQDFI